MAMYVSFSYALTRKHDTERLYILNKQALSSHFKYSPFSTMLEGSTCSQKQDTFLDIYIRVVDHNFVTGIYQ